MSQMCSRSKPRAPIPSADKSGSAATLPATAKDLCGSRKENDNGPRRKNERSASRGFFAHHFPGGFVIPKTEENRVSQFAISRPFGEFHLADDLRIDPATAPHLRRSDVLRPFPSSLFGQIRKRAILAPQLL